MKKAISKSAAKSWLRDIEQASQAYLRVTSPQDFEWPKEATPLADSLKAINMFGVIQSRPLLLAIMRIYLEKDFVKLKAIRQVVGDVENFTFRFNAITQSRGGGGVTGMYSNLARAVSSVSDATEFAEVRKQIIQRLRERNVDRNEFLAVFASLHYSNTYPRYRQLVRYVLGKLHQSMTNVKAADYSAYSIEHLAPQSGSLHEEAYGNIGNLAFVPEKLNGALGSKTFSAKKPILLKEGHGDGIFSEWENASELEIMTRAHKLAELAFDKVWKL